MKKMLSFKGWFLLVTVLIVGASSVSYAQWTETGNNITTTDNVGIGTTSPQASLEVRGSNTVGVTTDVLWLGGDGGATYGYKLRHTGGATESTDKLMLTNHGDVSLVTFQPNGRVGIGTTSPQASLEVRGSNTVGVTTDVLWLGGDGGGATYGYKFRHTGGATESTDKLMLTHHGDVALVTFQPNGDVGIGTTSPVANLHIKGGTSSPAVLRFQGTEPGTHQWEWRGTVNASNWGLMKLRNASTDSDVFSVREDGNVGIGTTSPTSKLHVVGNATFDGTVTGTNIAAQYQDVAEWVPTSDSLASGTVVVIDPIKNNRVLPSAQPYDTRVAGVVSARPGILLGEAGDGKAKVAHSGRVKVKVDAQNGSIEIGDILVTSATTGYAMRSAPVEVSGVSIHRPGTILGKALEPLREGKGEILVLLTLQ